MAGRQKRQPAKLRGSDARQLVSALRNAGVKGGDITLTGDGHLQVRCPDGELVILPSDVSAARTYANSRRDLAVHGVDIPSRGGNAGRGNRYRSRPQQDHRRLGQITRWLDGEPYALVTTAGDGKITWLISRSRLRPGVRDALAPGRLVTFTGNPVPDLHKRYPLARDVRLAEPPGNSGG